MLTKFESELNEFVDSSVKNLNSLGCTPFLNIFMSTTHITNLDTNSADAKRIFQKMSEEERQVFKEIVRLHQKKTEAENMYLQPLLSRVIKEIKETMKNYFSDSLAFEKEIASKMKLITNSRLFSLLKKLVPEFVNQVIGPCSSISGSFRHEWWFITRPIRPKFRITGGE